LNTNGNKEANAGGNARFDRGYLEHQALIMIMHETTGLLYIIPGLAWERGYYHT
jgi:hypothetical protein